MHKYNKHILLSINAVALVLIILFISPVFAATTNTVVTVTVNSVVAISSSGSVNLSIIPLPAGSQSANSDLVSVSTTDPNGYSLFIADASSVTNSLLGSGSNTIPATTSTTSTSPVRILSAGYWGFCASTTTLSNFTCPSSPFSSDSIHSDYDFAQVPLYTNPLQIKRTVTTATNDPTTVWYGVSLNTSTPSGSYATTVTYTATGN